MCAVAWANLASGSEPLREEDIVRMLVNGASEAAILDRIHSSTTEFALDPEMLDELRLAGLSATVIEAMIERQRELTPQAETSVVQPAPEPGRDLLRVRFEAPADRAPRLVLDRRAADTVLEPEEPLTDLALYLACRTPDHVPDHWRSESPVGRDFDRARRHRILVFHAGAEPASGEAASRLELELPPGLEVELSTEAAHDLTLGIAVRGSGRFKVLSVGDLDGVVLRNGGLTLQASLDLEGPVPAVRLGRGR